MCGSCRDPHEKIEGSFTPVTFYERKSEKYLQCEKHAADIIGFSCCGEYACMYCLNRNHKKHDHQALKEVDEALRDVVVNNLEARRDINIRLEEIKEAMEDVKNELEMVLSRKFLNCMASYASFLTAEAEHLRKYFLDLLTKYTEDMLALDSTEFFKSCLLKKGVEFILNESEVNMRMKNKTIPRLTVSLTEGVFKDEHPLGILEFTKGVDACPLTDKVFISKISLANIAPLSAPVEGLIEMLLEWSGNSNIEKSPVLQQKYEMDQFLGKGHISFKIDQLSKLEDAVASTPANVRGLMWYLKFHRKKHGCSLFLYSQSEGEKKPLSCYCRFLVSILGDEGKHLHARLARVDLNHLEKVIIMVGPHLFL